MYNLVPELEPVSMVVSKETILVRRVGKNQCWGLTYFTLSLRARVI